MFHRSLLSKKSRTIIFLCIICLRLFYISLISSPRHIAMRGEDFLSSDIEKEQKTPTQNISYINTGRGHRVRNETDNVTLTENQEENADKNQKTAPTHILPRPHPRAGARHPNGTFGYVADPTLIRRNYLREFYTTQANRPLANFLKLNKNESDYVCSAPPKFGLKSEEYNLLSKVVINATNPTADDAIATEIPGQRKSKAPRILCAVYTHPANHDQIEAIIDTWGWRCDGFIAASTITNETIGVVDIPHLGKEVYDSMWQKLRSFWSYLGDNHVNEYDFFWIGGDDTQLIVENLRNYLWGIRESIGEERFSTEPLHLGGVAPFPSKGAYSTKTYFVLGSGGYVLNRVILKKMLNADNFMKCKATEIKQSAEDRMLSFCLKENLAITGNDTVDARGAIRFHAGNPVSIMRLTQNRYDRSHNEWVKQLTGFQIARNGKRFGIDTVSTQTIAFHHSKYPLVMKRKHAILYNSCPLGTGLGDAQKTK